MLVLVWVLVLLMVVAQKENNSQQALFRIAQGPSFSLELSVVRRLGSLALIAGAIALRTLSYAVILVATRYFNCILPVFPKYMHTKCASISLLEVTQRFWGQNTCY